MLKQTLLVVAGDVVDAASLSAQPKAKKEAG
jgi:hypothetical protein